MTSFEAKKLKAQKPKKIKPNINCKHCNDYGFCVLTGQVCIEFEKICDNAERIVSLFDAIYNIGEEMFWIKNIALNWQIKEQVVIISISEHVVDIRLKDPIFIGPRKIKVLNLSVPKHELFK